MYSFDLYQFLANLSLAIPNYRADPNALAMKPGKRSPAKLAVCDRFSSPQLERSSYQSPFYIIKSSRHRGPVDTAPSYREAFRKLRCLIPVNGFMSGRRW